MNIDNIVFLLGAGASKEAGLKTSDEMTKALEQRLDTDWRDYKKLYNAVKAGILYGSALRGNPRTTVNIEEFVNVLTELSQCKDHVIFPFIASWNMELMETAGRNFEQIGKFRDDIIQVLVNEWVNLQDPTTAQYYENLLKFATDIGTNLRVFSLNYDTCVEKACLRDQVFTGFLYQAGRAGRPWNDRAMRSDNLIGAPLRLYKLHGSVDWREENGVVVSYESPNKCNDASKYQLIFGTTNKLRYTDPYLVLLSEFRNLTADAKLIVCIGYDFQDEHINGILHNAFAKEAKTTLLMVSWAPESEREQKVVSERKRVAKQLNVKESFIQVSLVGAKAFMENELKVAKMETIMAREDLPF